MKKIRFLSFLHNNSFIFKIDKKYYLIYLISFLIIISPIIISFFYIYQFSVDVPYYDTWRYVDYIEKFFTKELKFLDLFDAVGPHKGFLGLSFMFLNVKFFDWNIRLHYFLGFIFQIFSSIILVNFYWPITNFIKNSLVRIMGIFPIFIIFFSLRQWENSLATWSVSFNGGVFFVLLGIFLINKKKIKWLVLASISGFLGTLTFVTGLLIWPIGILQIFLSKKNSRYEENTKWYLMYWIFCSVLAGLIYFPGVNIPESSATNISNVVPTIIRFFITLGAPLSMDKGVISGQSALIISKIDGLVLFLFGIMLFLIVCYHIFLSWFYKSKLNPLLISILLLGLLSIGLTALGRVGLGYQQAMSSRYTTYSNIFLVASYFSILEVANNSLIIEPFRKVSKEILKLVVILIIISNTISTITELNMGIHRRALYKNWADAVINYSNIPDEKLVNPHFEPDQIREYSEILDRYDLSLFRK